MECVEKQKYRVRIKERKQSLVLSASVNILKVLRGTDPLFRLHPDVLSVGSVHGGLHDLEYRESVPPWQRISFVSLFRVTVTA